MLAYHMPLHPSFISSCTRAVVTSDEYFHFLFFQSNWQVTGWQSENFLQELKSVPTKSVVCVGE